MNVEDPRRARKRALVRFGLAVLAAGVAVLPALMPAHLWSTGVAFLVLVGAVVCAAVSGGLWAALAATMIGALGTAYYLEPRGGFEISRPADRLLLLVFIAVGLLVGTVIQRARREVVRLHAEAADLRSRSFGAGPVRQRVAELDALFASAPIGFAILDLEGRHLHVNERLCELGGMSAEAHLGRTIGEVVPDVARTLEPAFARVVATGEAVRDLEVLGATPATGGTPHHFVMGLYPIRDPEGAMTSVGLVVNDVTERRRMENALRTSEARLRRLWESNVIGIMYTTTSGEILDANDAILRALGYDRDELRRGLVRWADMTPRELLHFDERGIAEALERGACTPYEKVYIGKDGRVVPILIGYALLPGSRSEFITFVIDRTEQKRIEREREALLESERAARAEAERASRMKDEFVATVSHELRTPLNAILGFSQLLRRPSMRAPEKLDHGLDVVERNARLLAQLISDLLDVSRIVSGKVRLEPAPMALSSAVETALDGLRAAAEAKGLTLAASLPREDAPVLGDAGRLVQVVSNLVSNAVKFTPRGGHVRVSLTRAAGCAELEVADDGQGIPSEFLPHIFDRFRQADASTARRHGGLGLGLSIVKHLVELHGGAVRAESDGLGRGARFTVALPLLDDGADLPDSRDVRAAVSDRAILAGVRVLVVEDEPDAREMALRVLEESGAAVRTAASAAEALAAIDAARPDVLVSDIGLPEMDGYELIRRVRAGAPARDVPAIALTAFARPEDRTRALGAGFQSHVTKPLEPSALVATVARLWRRRAATA
ncbi:MAG: ATP-binding protein [Minicystis sp.]